MATLTDAFLADLDDLSDGDNELEEEQKEDDIIDEVSFVLHLCQFLLFHLPLLAIAICMPACRPYMFLMSKQMNYDAKPPLSMYPHHAGVAM
jgi:hypothetical protein